MIRCKDIRLVLATLAIGFGWPADARANPKGRPAVEVTFHDWHGGVAASRRYRVPLPTENHIAQLHIIESEARPGPRPGVTLRVSLRRERDGQAVVEYEVRREPGAGEVPRRAQIDVKGTLAVPETGPVTLAEVAGPNGGPSARVQLEVK